MLEDGPLATGKTRAVQRLGTFVCAQIAFDESIFAAVGCWFCWTMSFFHASQSYRHQEAGRDVGFVRGQIQDPEIIQGRSRVMTS